MFPYEAQMKKPSRALSVAAICFAASYPLSAQEADAPLERIAFGSCLHQDADQDAIWAAVRAEEPDLFIFAGDNVYADTRDKEEFRAAWQKLLDQPGYQALKAETPVMATWDDHDYGENDAGREYPLRETAQRLFLDTFEVPADSPRRDREGIYDARIFGPEGRRVQVILLDTRYHRSPLVRYPDEENGRWGAYKPLDDREATFLGDKQWEWLEEQLRKPAEVRLLVSSIQVVASQHRWEKWSNIPGERRRLLRLIEDTGAEGLVILSGDRHHAELSRLTDGVPYSLLDLTSSGMTQSNPWREGRPEKLERNRYRVGTIHRGHHFGTVDVDWSRPDPVLTLRIVGKDGAELLQHRVQLSELRADPPPATGPQWRQAEGAVPMRVDGRFHDWPEGRYLRVHEGWLYGRFSLPQGRIGLPASGLGIFIGMDTDLDRESGRAGIFGKGLEAALYLNYPRGEDDYPYETDFLVDWTEDGRRFTAAEIGWQLGPTHAARNYEFALPLERLRELGAFAESAALRCSIAFIDHKSSAVAPLRTVETVLPAAPAPAVTDAAVPEKPAEALRVVAYNVLWGTPQEEPASFARIFKALDADLILLQEWDRERDNEAEVAAWFNEHVADGEDVFAAVAGGAPGWWGGVGVVTPHKVIARLPEWNRVEAGGWDFPLRMAGAVVATPQGRLLTASVHLKASGADIRSAEDARRAAEAVVVNEMMRGAASLADPDLVVLGGDFNLVGSPDILTRCMDHLDTDGSDLAVAMAARLGEPSLLHTFRRARPGIRLDYIGFSESSWKAVNAFVLDTRILPAGVLRKAGLEAEDVMGSDHLPLVLDLVRR
mgnify:CR=1 FL=1